MSRRQAKEDLEEEEANETEQSSEEANETEQSSEEGEEEQSSEEKGEEENEIRKLTRISVYQLTFYIEGDIKLHRALNPPSKSSLTYPTAVLSKYEQIRAANIKRNNDFLETLGIATKEPPVKKPSVPRSKWPAISIENRKNTRNKVNIV